MKAKIIFEDWKKDDYSIYSTEEGTQLTLGSFHAGSTFDVDINLTQDDEEDIKRAIKEGYTPIFSLNDE